MCFSPHHYHPTPAGGQPARPPASQPASQPPVEPRECVSWASVSVLSGLYDRHRQAEDKGVRLLMFRSFDRGHRAAEQNNAVTKDVVSVSVSSVKQHNVQQAQQCNASAAKRYTSTQR